MRIFFGIFFILIFGSKVQKQGGVNDIADSKMSIYTSIDSASLNVMEEQRVYTARGYMQLRDSSFVKLSMLDLNFSYDMKYATTDNFLKEKVYNCDDCWLRFETAKKVIRANEILRKRGLHIHFFDCYRPLSVQKKMWKLFPDKRYVADPEQGSNHNRGTAVDITIADSLGNILDMGTDFDHFGRKAHYAYKKLPDTVVNNRVLLRQVMEQAGFWGITSEWWHFNLNKSYRYGVSDFEVRCDE